MNLCKTPNKLQSAIECLVLLALAVALRALYIGKTDLGGDESFTLYMALQSLPDIVAMLTRGDNPPLWETLLHFGPRFSTSPKSPSAPCRSFSAH